MTYIDIGFMMLTLWTMILYALIIRIERKVYNLERKVECLVPTLAVRYGQTDAQRYRGE